jgi:hypothetical protein
LRQAVTRTAEVSIIVFSSLTAGSLLTLRAATLSLSIIFFSYLIAGSLPPLSAATLLLLSCCALSLHFVGHASKQIACVSE